MSQPSPASLATLSLPHRPYRLAGSVVVAIAIASLVAMVLWSIAHAGSGATSSGSTPDVAHLLRMTSIQAGLSTILSLIVGTGLAWALNRLRFWGRDLVVGLFSSAIVTPGLIVAFGLLSVWGRSGWVNQGLGELFGFSIGNPMFGLPGILAAHVILDAAFAARIILARLDSIPTTRLKTGQSLALSAWQRFAVIDWPAIRGTLPGLGAIIFLLAFTSFPIVLLLGGGPANQTLEVAIYSAVRLDFDLPAAVTLALVQIAACSVVIITSAVLAPIPSSLGPSSGQSWADSRLTRIFQWIILFACVIGFALPLIAVLVDGLTFGLAELIARPSFWKATGTSLIIGSLSACTTLILSLAIAMGRASTARPILRISLGIPSYAYLAVPAVVLGLGFFLLVRDAGADTSLVAPIIVIIANALLALPFAVATLAPPLDAIARSRGKLIRSLGLSSVEQFRLVEWPLIGRDIGVVLALAFCFSLGDLGVISLFGTENFSTLPLMMMRALGAYRTNDAAAIAALMLVLTVLVFTLLPRLFESWSNAEA